MESGAQSSRAIAAFAARPRLIELRGTVQHYSWGGYHSIPRLLGAAESGGAVAWTGDRKPFAELWIGAHPKSPATALLGDAAVGLDRLIDAAPEAVLGRGDARRFEGKLPYLLKIIDARTMLSIQVHPSRKNAREGFAREESARIAFNDPRRTYLDSNQKQEVHAALSEFWMLHGFRPLEAIARSLREVPELRPLAPELDAKLKRACGVSQGKPESQRHILRSLYTSVMTMPQDRVDRILGPLVSRLEAAERERALEKGSPEFWALRASREFPLPNGHIDRGLFSLWLLNLLHLSAGQGTFQPAGTLHAYLEGTTVELMTSSDNVFRGGLTSKRVDVEGLIAAVEFEAREPPILTPRRLSSTEGVFETPAEEFRLSRIEVAPGVGHRQEADHGVDCMIMLDGAGRAVSPGADFALRPGTIVLAPADVSYRLEAEGSAPSVFFKATVPRGAR